MGYTFFVYSECNSGVIWTSGQQKHILLDTEPYYFFKT